MLETALLRSNGYTLLLNVFQSILLGGEQVFSLCTPPKNWSRFFCFGVAALAQIAEFCLLRGRFTCKVIFKGQGVIWPTLSALL